MAISTPCRQSVLWNVHRNVHDVFRWGTWGHKTKRLVYTWTGGPSHGWTAMKSKKNNSGFLLSCLVLRYRGKMWSNCLCTLDNLCDHLFVLQLLSSFDLNTCWQSHQHKTKDHSLPHIHDLCILEESKCAEWRTSESWGP